MKSSRQDEGDESKDMLKGVAKEATGALIGDHANKAKRLWDQTKGASSINSCSILVALLKWQLCFPT